MAITPEDRDRMRLSFAGFWKGPDHDSVLDRAHAAYLSRFPGSTVTRAEFGQLLDLFGNRPVAVSGGGDRPHDVRLSIGTA